MVDISLLTVNLKVNFECFPSIKEATSIIFYRWLPVNEEHVINFKERNMSITLCFEQQSTWWASQPSLEEIKKWNNVIARYINVNVQVTDVPEEVACYIQSHNKTGDSKQKLQSAYDEIGEQIFTSVLKKVNRLIAFVRSKYGQYWITEFKIDRGRIRNFYWECDAKGRIDEGPWFEFRPNGGLIVIHGESDNNFIKETEWADVKNFVLGNQKSKLNGELLTNAELLFNSGQIGSAITEAVTALEISLYAFGKSPNANKAFGNKFDRIGNMSLQKQIDHYGLSGSIRYLLPLILPEEVMPIKILTECDTALTCRQNIVHNGQRDIKEETARVAIFNIRKCCEILAKITQDNDD